MPSIKEEILLMISEGLVYLLNPYHFFQIGTRSGYYKAVERLEKRGMVTKIRRENRIFLKLTEKGRTQIKKHREAGKIRSRRWDGKWRLIIFDIPEEKNRLRYLLRKYLKTLGYAKVQRSIWISPFDLQKAIDGFCKKMKIADYIFQLTVEKFREMEDKALALSFWPLKKLDAEYKKLLKEYSSRLQNLDGENNDPFTNASPSQRLLQSLIWDYQTILASDPQLPSQLLPEDWGGDRVRAYITRMQRSGAPSGSRD